MFRFSTLVGATTLAISQALAHVINVPTSNLLAPLRDVRDHSSARISVRDTLRSACVLDGSQPGDRVYAKNGIEYCNCFRYHSCNPSTAPAPECCNSAESARTNIYFEKMNVGGLAWLGPVPSGASIDNLLAFSATHCDSAECHESVLQTKQACFKDETECVAGWTGLYRYCDAGNSECNAAVWKTLWWSDDNSDSVIPKDVLDWTNIAVDLDAECGDDINCRWGVILQMDLTREPPVGLRPTIVKTQDQADALKKAEQEVMENLGVARFILHTCKLDMVCWDGIMHGTSTTSRCSHSGGQSAATAHGTRRQSRPRRSCSS